jgi:membrane-bound serine protease (ClpP class)
MFSHPNVVFLLLGVAIVGMGILGFVLMTFATRAQRRPFLNGVDGMVGATVVAITALAPEGRVNYAGENWAAVLAAPDQLVRAGTELQIVSIEGLRLRVRPLSRNNRVETDYVVHSNE